MRKEYQILTNQTGELIMKTDLTLAICMYNAEQYIKETLQSVMVQTIQNFHLLIINDSSTDQSVEIVKKFFKDHPREFELVNLPENRGLCSGRHYVEEHTTTKYIMFLDADDILYPQAIQTLYNKITSDKDLMAVGCYLEYIDEKSKKLGGGIFLGETTKESFYKKAAKEKLIFMQPTAIYDRKAALSVGGHNINGFPKGKPHYQDLCEDLDLWTRMSDLYKERKAIVVVPEILCRYRKYSTAMSTNSVGMILRMRHIKTNLKRRRRGEKELSFIEFRQQLSNKELSQIKKDAKSADSLRTAYYNFKTGKFLKSIKNIGISIKNNPYYIIDKIRHNFLRLK